MKKFVSILIAFLMLLSFAACDGDSTEKESSDNTSAIGEADTGNKDSEKKDSDEISFTELVVVDNDECTVKITGIEPNNIWGYTLKAFLENKSTEKTYMFSVRGASINGVQCDPLFSTEVAAEKKSNNDISFSDTNLKEHGIDNFTDIELYFVVYDSEDWSGNLVAEETVHIYPYGEDKAVKFEREAQASDTVLVDNDDVTVTVIGYEEDAVWGYTVNLFLVNKTEKNVMFSVADAAVNGFMADPFYATTVSAGKCAFSSMSWSDTTFEDNSIVSVEEITFTLRAYDADNYFDDIVNESIKLVP